MQRNPAFALCLSVLFALLLTASRSQAEMTLQPVGVISDIGTNPSGPMVLSPDGNFYGTTLEGGDYKGGTVYRYNPQTGAIQFAHSFSWIQTGGDPNSGGCHPEGKLLCAPDGSLFGVTRDGGAYGFGTIFKVAADGSFSVLHDFDTGHISTPVLQFITAEGDLYGYSQTGGYCPPPEGFYGNGYLFRLDQKKGYSVIYTFGLKAPANLPDLEARCWPSGPTGLVQTADGAIYGSASQGGIETNEYVRGAGGIFRLDPDSQDISLIRNYPRDEDTAYPSLWMAGNDGALYGVGSAGLCKYFPDGQAALIHRYTSEAYEGSSPQGVILAEDGCLYWNTRFGGANYHGTINKLTADGQFSVMQSIAYEISYCRTGITAGNDGYLYMVANVDSLPEAVPALMPTAQKIAPTKPIANDLSMLILPSAVPSLDSMASSAMAPRSKSKILRIQAPGLPLETFPPVARDDHLTLNTLRKIRVSGTLLYERLIPVLVNDRDAQRYPLSLLSVSSPQHGWAAIDSRTQKICYRTPLPLQDQFSYTISDGQGGTATANVSLLSSRAGIFEGSLAGSGAAANVANSLRVSTNGGSGVSGKFVLASGTCAFSGRANASGRFLRKYTPRNKEPYQVELWIQPTETSWEITCKIKVGDAEFTGTLPKIQ